MLSRPSFCGGSSQLGTLSKAGMQIVEDAIRIHLGLAK